MAKQLLHLNDVDINAKTTGEVTRFRDSVLVTEAVDEADARAFIVATAASYQYGLERGNITLKEEFGGGDFKFLIDYNTPNYENAAALPSTSVNFDIGGGMRHMTTALTTVAKYGDTNNDFKNAINVDADFNIQGLDVPDNCLKYSETHYFIKKSITAKFLTTLKTMSNTVNNKIWRGFEKGEILFIGASGSWNEETRIVGVTYNFEIRKSEPAQSIGDIECDAKYGWDYRWIFYGKKKNASGFVMAQPITIFDVRPFWFADFANLGIGEK